MAVNGYNDSVLETESGVCFFCGLHCDTARHEIYYGTANRQKAKLYGYWVNICPKHHREAHKEPNTGVDLWLKQTGQIEWEKTRTRESFIKVWGRSYL